MFAAVDLTVEARAALLASFDEWGRAVPERRVPPANWHLTLRFYGDTDAVAFDRLCAALEEAVPPRPFRIRLDGLGAFPRPVSASFLWVGVTSGSDQLGVLAASAETAGRQVGFAPEERPFVPHMTVARMRPTVDVRPLLERDPPPSVVMPVAAVTLFRTLPTSGGVVYEPLETFPL